MNGVPLSLLEGDRIVERQMVYLPNQSRAAVVRRMQWRRTPMARRRPSP